VYGDWKSDAISQGVRFLACSLLLFQLHLAGGELSDLSFFVPSLVIAAVVGFGAAVAGLRSWIALAILGVIPFIVRAAIGGISVVAKFDAINADTALLAYDRNLLVSLLPLYWSGITAYFAKVSRRFLRIEPFINGVALTIFFAYFDARTFLVYEKPIVLAAAVVTIVFLEFIVLAESTPLSVRILGRKRFGVALTVAAVCFFAVAVMLKPFEEKAASQGGGLIKPSLFRFDFSQYLRLESEISLSEDLVLIVRKDSEDRHTLIRRFVLSDYDKQKGFQRKEGMDDLTHPLSLPEAEINFAETVYKRTKSIDQEYFLVNFDASAFIAMNQPTKVVPYKTWNASSFTSVYATKSAVSDVLPFELIDSVEKDGVGMVRRVLGNTQYAILTNFGDDPRIKKLALQVTEGSSGYWDNVQAIYERLKYGEYRYSLKPGVASDGDQLGRFLFEAKKGYCSYFAFSMTLLLRSIGIPARTAVGFFVDPATAAFNYYPVRSDMAHAWVEVFFPGYGWIEYDPTSEQLADGEDFRFSSGVPPEQFEKLMKEILSNREHLAAQTLEDVPGLTKTIPKFIGSMAAFARDRWGFIIVLFWALFALVIRCGLFLRSKYTRSPRVAAEYLAKHTLRRLELAGKKRRGDESLGEFAERMDREWDLGLCSVMEWRTKALFAAAFTGSDLSAFRAVYESFSAVYSRRVAMTWRILAWIVPFVMIRVKLQMKSVVMLVFLGFLLPGDLARAQTNTTVDANDSASELIVQIEELITAERWEKAVDLLRGGEKKYPKDERFPIALGDLFADRKLYGLAWEEFRAAEKIERNDPALLYRLATTAGRLNKDDYSAAYLERVVVLRPDDRDAVGDLAWMYFKLHRLREAERFLLDAIARLGKDPGFSMTLGTIYSDLYEYESSKKWYQAAIDEAKRNKARTFEAVAQYNLSILESKYYRYAEAFKRTGQSLEAADRSSGHLARGELYLKRLDFYKTYAEYERAYELDVSPLSKLNLADAYLAAGRLAEARSYAEKALSVTDLSWMFNYGTNLNQYKRDVHDILSETYDGLANLESSYPRPGIWDEAHELVLVLTYRARSAGHRALFHEYSRKAAALYASAGQPLASSLNYFDAFSDYRLRALMYLKEAQEIERSLVPAAAVLYELERGRMERSTRRIEASLRLFDPVWQKDLTAKAYTALATLYPEGSAERADSAERLFALNRGSVRQHGVKLPVDIKILDKMGRKTSAIKRILLNSGFALAPKGMPIRFALEITVNGAEAYCSLTDTLRGTIILNRVIPLPSVSGKDLASFSRVLADAVFAAN